MRLRLLLLGLSLAANALLYAHWRRAANASSPLIVASPSMPPRVAAGPIDPTAHIDPETWAALAPQGDLAGFVAHLRAKGYPPAILRAILQVHVRDRFADRLKPLLEATAAQPYWRGSEFGPGADPKLSIARRALQREMNELTRQLLGADTDDPGDILSRRRRYGDLPSEKISDLERINADYNDLRSQVNAESRGVVFPEDREKLVLIEKERRADLARLLTPQELELYDLHTGRTSSQLRYQLGAFSPTEDEFRAVYKIHQSLDGRFGTPETLTPELRRQRTEAEKELGPQIANALGAERYADYQRTTDPAWRDAHRFVTQFDLPPTMIGQLATVQQEITQRADALRSNRSLPPDQRDAQIRALEQEAINRLTPVLGDRLADYRQNGGYWLRSLRPPPRPAPAP